MSDKGSAYERRQKMLDILEERQAVDAARIAAGGKPTWSDWTDVWEPDSKTVEEEMRNKYPAMQDAWEQYQIVKKMCEAGEIAPEPTGAEILLNQIKARKNSQPPKPTAKERLAKIQAQFRADNNE